MDSIFGFEDALRHGLLFSFEHEVLKELKEFLLKIWILSTELIHKLAVLIV
jgi:hypothetical protein